MSKSTPINQLQQPAPSMDVLESISPQNNDIVDDDDATIQEVLNTISGPNNNKQKQQQLPIFDNNEKNQDLLEQHQQLLQANEILKKMNDQKEGSDPNVNATLDNLIMNSNKTQNIIKNSIANFTGNVSDAILIMCIVIVIHFIPLHKYISKYFSIEKIPYNVIILRALLAVFLFFTINKLFLKN